MRGSPAAAGERSGKQKEVGADFPGAFDLPRPALPFRVPAF